VDGFIGLLVYLRAGLLVKTPTKAESPNIKSRVVNKVNGVTQYSKESNY
jgi:hypothetical protein